MLLAKVGGVVGILLIRINPIKISRKNMFLFFHFKREDARNIRMRVRSNCGM